MVQCSPVHEALCVHCSVVDVGTGVMQHCDTLHENTGTLPVDGSVKISKESITVLWVDGDVRSLNASISSPFFMLGQILHQEVWHLTVLHCSHLH